MQTFKTEQESFWASEFGDHYINRNEDEKLLASNIALFSKILSRTSGINSVLELGANIGLNLRAIRTLLPAGKFSAVEINQQAVQQLRSYEYIEAHQTLAPTNVAFYVETQAK